MPLLQTPPGAVVRIDGREYLYFVGTGYLGLQGHPEVIRVACEAAQQYGIGSANSRHRLWHHAAAAGVERAAAALFGMDDAFLFRLGLDGQQHPCAVARRGIGPGADRRVFSLQPVEAARLSRWPCITFHHTDADDLRAKLKEHLKPGDCPLVLSDGVFAATGRIASANAYCEVLRDYPGSVLCLDDAHGLAVLGENGRGTFEHVGLWPKSSPLPLAGEGPGVRAAGIGRGSEVARNERTAAADS